jgi:hypothetical protein
MYLLNLEDVVICSGIKGRMLDDGDLVWQVHYQIELMRHSISTIMLSQFQAAEQLAIYLKSHWNLAAGFTTLIIG